MRIASKGAEIVSNLKVPSPILCTTDTAFLLSRVSLPSEVLDLLAAELRSGSDLTEVCRALRVSNGAALEALEEHLGSAELARLQLRRSAALLVETQDALHSLLELSRQRMQYLTPAETLAAAARFCTALSRVQVTSMLATQQLTALNGASQGIVVELQRATLDDEMAPFLLPEAVA